MAMASSSSRNGGTRGGSMRPVSGANSSNLRSSSFKSRIPSSAPAPRRSSSAALGGGGGGDNGGVPRLFITAHFANLILTTIERLLVTYSPLDLLSKECIFALVLLNSARESSSGSKITTSECR